MLLDEGHDVAEFGIIASGPNGASPHHLASDRIISDGDLVVMDFGGRKWGYWSDTTRTFVVGTPNDRHMEIHAVVKEAQRRGRDTVKPGIRCEEIDAVVREVIESAGYGEFFIHRTGHGIGLEVHERPYLVSGSDVALEEGMTFSIEPGIYIPGELGVRIEDIVACTADGIESLNDSPRDLISVE